MIRAFLKLALLLVIVLAAAGFLLGWWSGYKWDRAPWADRPTGTTGRIDPGKAREVGTQIAEKTAAAAAKAEAALSDAALTTKIKSKMALDDTVRARTIDVDTSNHVVTLTGVVGSEAERRKAVQLARETNGVTSVVDHLKVR